MSRGRAARKAGAPALARRPRGSQHRRDRRPMDLRPNMRCPRSAHGPEPAAGQSQESLVAERRRLPRVHPATRKKLTLARIALLATIAATGSAADAHEQGTLAARVPGTKWVVTVNEGPHEPRSIGSYAVRIYTPYDSDWPYDAFTTGLVRARDGSVEALKFADIDGDGTPEIIVVVRSAGSGGYLSADALSLRDAHLVVTARAEGLAWNADPIRALRNAWSPPPLPDP